MNATSFAPANLLTSLPSSTRKEIVPEATIVSSGRAFSLTGAQAHQRIRVLDGLLWITQEGDSTDHLVGPGDVFVPSGSGRVVVESLVASSRFVIVPNAD